MECLLGEKVVSEIINPEIYLDAGSLLPEFVDVLEWISMLPRAMS